MSYNVFHVPQGLVLKSAKNTMDNPNVFSGNMIFPNVNANANDSVQTSHASHASHPSHPIPIPVRMTPSIIIPTPIMIPMEELEYNYFETKCVEYLFDMPGVLKASIVIAVTAEPQAFTVTGTRISGGKGASLCSCPSEFKYGPMSRRVELKPNIDAFTATAKYVDGILHVMFKKRNTSFIYRVMVD